MAVSLRDFLSAMLTSNLVVVNCKLLNLSSPELGLAILQVCLLRSTEPSNFMRAYTQFAELVSALTTVEIL